MGSQLVHAIYHGYVQHGPALPLRSLGRIYARGSPRIRTRPDPHARRIQGFLMVILQYLEGKQLAWKRRTDDFLDGQTLAAVDYPTMNGAIDKALPFSFNRVFG